MGGICMSLYDSTVHEVQTSFAKKKPEFRTDYSLWHGQNTLANMDPNGTNLFNFGKRELDEVVTIDLGTGGGKDTIALRGTIEDYAISIYEDKFVFTDKETGTTVVVKNADVIGFHNITDDGNFINDIFTAEEFRSITNEGVIEAIVEGATNSLLANYGLYDVSQDADGDASADLSIVNHIV